MDLPGMRTVLNEVFLGHAARLCVSYGDAPARRMFCYSITYLLYSPGCSSIVAGASGSDSQSTLKMRKLQLKLRNFPPFWVGVLVGLMLVALACAVV
jgi:hypothetical protein